MSSFTGGCTAYQPKSCIGGLSSPVFNIVPRLAILTAYRQFINMAEPPSYEDSTSGVGRLSDYKGDSKTHRQWSIREQVGLSRTQHVASIVSQIVEHIRERATQGLSKTTLVLIPSDQGTSVRAKEGDRGSNTTQMQVEKVPWLALLTARCRL